MMILHCNILLVSMYSLTQTPLRILLVLAWSSRSSVTVLVALFQRRIHFQAYTSRVYMIRISNLHV